jgi:Ca-activated chloride channel family protein
MEMAAKNLDIERESRVVLLSDGNSTAGPADADVATLTDTYVGEGIGLTTIGVGDDFNVSLMRGLAERGTGNFYFVEDAQAVTEVFTQELEYFVSAIALDLQVEVESDPSHVFGEVLGTSRWETGDERFGSMKVPALFLASRKSDTPDPEGRRGGGSSLFIAMNPQTGQFQTDKMATVRARYRMPGAEEFIETEVSVENPFRDAAPAAGYASHEGMLEAYAMYNMFLGLRAGSAMAQESYDCALDIVESLRETAIAWNQAAPDEDIAADIELVEIFKANLVDEGAAAGRAIVCEYDLYESGVYEAQDPGFYQDDPYLHEPMACSAGSAGQAGPLGIALLLLAMARRFARRRRG